MSDESDNVSAMQMITAGGSRWRLAMFEGRRVFQRDDLFKLTQIDMESGLTNLELMQKGNAPKDEVGARIVLHHMLQREPGPIAEITEEFHRKHFGKIHINIMKNPSAPRSRYEEIRPRSAFRIKSGVDRDAFDPWRERYWKERARLILATRSG